MTSLFYFSSTDPDNYGEVKASITPIVSQPVQVRVTGIQYQANFSLTTKEDYLELEIDGEKEVFNFPEWGVYPIESVPLALEGLTNKKIAVLLDSTGLLTYTGNAIITGVSHRASLIMGLYHVKLPIDIRTGYTAPSVPLVNYGSILYLMSNIPSIVGLGDKNKEEYRSIAYKGSDFLHPGIPVNSRTPGPIVTTKSDNLTVLKFQLVDFMLQPVILHSPLYITFEVFYNIVPTPMLQGDGT